MVIVIIYLEEVYVKTKYYIFLLSVWDSQPNSMVNVFGDNTGEKGGLVSVERGDGNKWKVC